MSEDVALPKVVKVHHEIRGEGDQMQFLWTIIDAWAPREADYKLKVPLGIKSIVSGGSLAELVLKLDKLGYYEVSQSNDAFKWMMDERLGEPTLRPYMFTTIYHRD